MHDQLSGNISLSDYVGSFEFSARQEICDDDILEGAVLSKMPQSHSTKNFFATLCV